MVDPRFKTGARRSPPHKLLAAEPHRVIKTPPPKVAYVPSQLSMWDNDHDGDCVTAEEAFAKACYSPEIFIPDQEVIRWASSHGVLNGADLAEVLDWMAQKGFQGTSGQLYNDGPKQGVDYSNETVLQSALASGLDSGNPSPVKIAIDANALPSGAGNQSGWYSFGKGNFTNTDHCVSLAGYGTAGDCFQALGVPVPSGIDPNKPSCYLLYTWKTIGVVDHDWLMGTCTEAWVRGPTTVGVPPLTPTPPPPPPPGPGPGPTPTPTPGVLDISGTVVGTVSLGLLGTHPINAVMTGKAIPESTHAELAAMKVKWLQLIQDVIKLDSDYNAGNWTAIPADIKAVVADLTS